MVTALPVTPRERRRAARFALALDGGLEGGVHDSTVAPLLRLAEALAATPRPAPSEEFRRALRQRLLAVGTVTAGQPLRAGDATGDRAGGGHWRRRLVAASAALAVTTGGAATTAVASTDALPGDALYDVKRTVESVQLALATTELAKGERHLQIAATRLDEVAGLLDEHGAQPTDPVVIERLRKTLGSAGTSAELGSDQFFAAYRESRDPAVLRPLDAFLRQQAEELSTITPMLPADLLISSRELLSGFQRIAAELMALSGDRSGGGLGSATPADARPNDPAPAAAPRSGGRSELPLPGLPAAGDRVGGAASDVTSAVPGQGLIGLDVAPGNEGVPDVSAQSGSGPAGLPAPVPGISVGVNPTDKDKLLGVVTVPSVDANPPLPGSVNPKLP
jgi:hypothetical protein